MPNYGSGKSSGKAERTGGRATLRTGCACAVGDFAFDNMTLEVPDLAACPEPPGCLFIDNPFPTPDTIKVTRSLLWVPPPGQYVLPAVGSFFYAAPNITVCRFMLTNLSGEACGNPIEDPGCSEIDPCVENRCLFGADYLVVEFYYNPSTGLYVFEISIGLPIYGSGTIQAPPLSGNNLTLFAFLGEAYGAACNRHVCSCDYVVPVHSVGARRSFVAADVLSLSPPFLINIIFGLFCDALGPPDLGGTPPAVVVPQFTLFLKLTPGP